MTKTEAIDFFGGVAKLADAIDVTDGAISQWGEYPPGGRQLQLQTLTRGKLKAEPDCMKSKRAGDKVGA